MAYIDCDKCCHGRVCAHRHHYHDMIVECNHYVPTDNVVEVVRCKDCAHYIEMKGFEYNGRKARSCVWHSALRGENDFCSDAIKKGGRS